MSAITPEAVFSACTLVVFPGWALLMLAPRSRVTRLAVLSGGLSLLLALVYLVLVAWYFPRARGGFGSLEQVALLFRDRWLLLAGWIHYLAFDLFVGAWEVRDAEGRGVPHVAVVPCLLLTFLFGPVGLISYFILRAVAAARHA